MVLVHGMLRKMPLQMNGWVHLFSVKEQPKSNDENIERLIRSYVTSAKKNVLWCIFAMMRVLDKISTKRQRMVG